MQIIKDKIDLPLFSLSALLHFLFFIAVGLTLHFSQKTTLLGNQEERILSSYIYKTTMPLTYSNTNQTQKTKVTHASDNKIKINNTAKLGLATKTNKPIVDPVKNAVAQTKQTAATNTTPASHGQPADELLTLLHTAIQNQQRYPDSAMQMEREGRSTVTFILQTNGQVENVHITKTSGTQSLDEAALAAVHAAAPFKHIDKYLHNAQEYSIDVVFELT